ncbi:MAG: heparan N-sulfatase [Marinilabiliales bacterium]|nr:MAG: heparan N-sulfatase [Marinilabiliales bacterium]
MSLLKNNLVQILPLSILAASCSTSEEAPADLRPNIVMIVSDDHGTDDLGCYGNTAIKTPNLDALAAEGIRFTNAYCTSASCSASRSVILTGLYNHATGQYGHEHSFHHFSTFENVRSLPVILADNGYRTGRVGKYHIAPESVYFFEDVIPGNQRNPHEMAVNSREFLSGNRDKPFFLYFCTSDPHRGGGVVEDDPYRPDRFGNRDQGYEGITETFFTPDEVEVPWYLPDTPATRAELAQYYQSVARMDQGIGTLFDILKEEGLWDNTVVMYFSDNGIAFHGAKTNLYDPAMRLPFIVKMPDGKNGGRVTDAMVTWADLTPTILDMAGALENELEYRQNLPREPSWAVPAHHDDFHGRTFLPVLNDPDTEGYDEIFASHTFHEITMYYPMRVVENREFKLIWNIASGLSYPHASDLWESSTWRYIIDSGAENYGPRPVANYLERPPFELFNMSDDPHETINLAFNPAYAAILEEMKERIKYYQERTGDPWINKWIHE